MASVADIRARMLMGPGPSDVHPRVLEAMARPTIGHLDGQFLEILNDIGDMLREVFRTRNELTLAVSGTGSAGMETCIVNLVEPGDRVLVCIAGVFGKRMADVAERAGAEVVTIDVPWGQVFTADRIEAGATCGGRKSNDPLGVKHRRETWSRRARSSCRATPRSRPSRC